MAFHKDASNVAAEAPRKFGVNFTLASCFQRGRKLGWISYPVETELEPRQKSFQSFPQQYDHQRHVQRLQTHHSSLQMIKVQETQTKKQLKFDLYSLPPDIRTMIYREALLLHGPASWDVPLAIHTAHTVWWLDGEFADNLIRKCAVPFKFSYKNKLFHLRHAFAIMQLDRLTRQEARSVFVNVIGKNLDIVLYCKISSQLQRSIDFIRAASKPLLFSLMSLKFTVTYNYSLNDWDLSINPWNVNRPVAIRRDIELRYHERYAARAQRNQIMAVLADERCNSKGKLLITQSSLLQILDIICFTTEHDFIK